MSEDGPKVVCLRVIAEDGSQKDVYKLAEELTPEEAAQVITDLTNCRRREQELLRALHRKYTRLHGHKYARLLNLDLADFFPPESGAASA